MCILDPIEPDVNHEKAIQETINILGAKFRWPVIDTNPDTTSKSKHKVTVEEVLAQLKQTLICELLKAKGKPCNKAELVAIITKKLHESYVGLGIESFLDTSNIKCTELTQNTIKIVLPPNVTMPNEFIWTFIR